MGGLSFLGAGQVFDGMVCACRHRGRAWHVSHRCFDLQLASWLCKIVSNAPRERLSQESRDVHLNLALYFITSSFSAEHIP